MRGGEGRLVWSAPAENDLLDIRTYLAVEVSPRVADDQLRKIATACERLKVWPYSGPPRDDLRRGLRSLTVTPYIVLYRVSGPTCEIVRVLHGHRDLAAIISDPDET